MQSVKEICDAIKSAKGFTRDSELAKFLETSKQNICHWQRRGKIGDYGVFVKAGVSELFARTGEGEIFKNNTDGSLGRVVIPVLSWVQAGGWREIEEGGALGSIAIDRAYSKTTFALEVVGDSMAPEFPEGCTIVVDPESCAENGAYVVARVNGNEATFKQLVMDGGTTFLRPINDRYPLIDVTGRECVVVGVVREMRITKKYR